MNPGPQMGNVGHSTALQPLSAHPTPLPASLALFPPPLEGVFPADIGAQSLQWAAARMLDAVGRHWVTAARWDAQHRPRTPSHHLQHNPSQENKRQKPQKCGRNGAITVTKKEEKPKNFATGKRKSKTKQKPNKNPHNPKALPPLPTPHKNARGRIIKPRCGAAEAPARRAQRSRASHPGARSHRASPRPEGSAPPPAQRTATGGGCEDGGGSDGGLSELCGYGERRGNGSRPRMAVMCGVRSGAAPGGRRSCGVGTVSRELKGGGGGEDGGGTRSSSRGEFGLYGIANKEIRRGKERKKKY